MITEEIKKILAKSFSSDHFELINESHLHCGPESETHFKLILISRKFENQGAVQRHRMLYQELSEVIKKIHALALHLFTPDEWRKVEGEVKQSPACAKKRKT